MSGETCTTGAYKLYEQEHIRQVTGDTIRPGGLGLTRYALSMIDLPENGRVLDIACGPGATVEWLCSEMRLAGFGFDASPILLRDGLGRNPMLPLAQARADRLAVGPEVMDVALIECSLSTMPEPAPVLQEAWRVLCPGGHLILSDLYARSEAGLPELRALPVDCCLRYMLSQSEILTMVEARGFQLLAWEDHSNALRFLTGRIILSYGSMQQFWDRSTPPETDALDVAYRIALSRPGYYLLAAKKRRD